MSPHTQQPDPEEQLDARQLLQPIWRRKWLILFTVVLVTAGTYAFYAHKPKQYRTSTSIYIKTSELAAALGTEALFSDDDRNTLDQATLLDTPAVAAKVAKAIGFEGDSRALLGAVTATAQDGKDFISITATGSSPKQAADIANGFARAFIDMRSADQRDKVDRALKAAQSELSQTPGGLANADSRAALQSRIRQLNAVQGLPTGTAEHVDPAVRPGAAFEPRPQRAAVFGFVLSLLLAVGAAFALERLDRRIKVLEDVERLYRRPMLSALPRSSSPAPVVEGVPTMADTFREPFRSLRVNVELAGIDRHMRVVAVVSALPGEGKSTVIRNLALAYAEAGLRVAVVESDLRRPMLARTLNVEPRPGITDVLAGVAALSQALKPVKVSTIPERLLAPVTAGGGDLAPVSEALLPATGGSVTLITSGPEPPNPPVLLASEPFGAILDQLRIDYDLVLLDTAPLLVVSDAIPLIETADGTLIVTRFNETTRDAARRLMTIVNRVPKANVLGIVANDVPAREVGSGAYTYYGYTSHS